VEMNEKVTILNSIGLYFILYAVCITSLFAIVLYRCLLCAFELLKFTIIVVEYFVFS